MTSIHLGGHEGACFVQHFLRSGHLICLWRLGQVAGLDAGNLVHFESGVPASQQVISDHNWGVQRLQEPLTAEKENNMLTTTSLETSSRDINEGVLCMRVCHCSPCDVL